MSDANRTSLAYIEETTWGSCPATASNPLTELRFTSESLAYNVSSTQSNEIRDDRMVTDLILTDKNAAGGFNFEFSYGTFDEFLAGALWGSWTSNVLINGTTERSFYLERYHADVTQYFKFAGMVVNSMSLSVSAGQISTGSFDFVGKDSSLSATSINDPTAYTAQSTTTAFNGIDNVASIYEGGSELSGVFVQSLSLQVNNNVRGLKAIGSAGSQDIGVGAFEVTGSLQVYFANSTLYNKLINNTETSLKFNLNDGPLGVGGNNYLIEFPRTKYESGSINTGGMNQDVMQTLNFRALRKTTSDYSMMRITRTAA